MGFIISSNPNWIPRNWSNQEIRKIGSQFTGNVINVSAAQDNDKQGGKYKDYFPNAKSYTISNYGKGIEGISGDQDEIILDLSKQYSGSKYDVVFSHTVIEHLPSVEIAIDNLCNLSSDVVITVVPFIQHYHGRINSYTDYWRYSPDALINEFEKRGFSTIYVNWNDDFPYMSVYILHIASKYPNKYWRLVPQSKIPEINVCGPGVEFSKKLWGWDRTLFRRIGEYIGSRCVIDKTEGNIGHPGE
jgi:hypothetical protein